MRNSNIFIISILLGTSVLLIGCEGIIASNKPEDTCIAQGFVNRTDVEDLLVVSNRYIEVNNLCTSEDIPKYQYGLLFDQQSSCGQKGYIPVNTVNVIVEKTNHYIDVANRCTGGNNYAPLEHLPLFKNWAEG